MKPVISDDQELGPDPIRDEMVDGESLLWTGRPRVGRMVLISLPTLIMGVFFTAFALFWITLASMAPAPFRWFGFLFVAVGLGMMGAPLWAGIAASRTRYAITDRRVILREPSLWDGFRIRSYGPDQLGAMTRNQRSDGSGDLILEEVTTYHHHQNRVRPRITRRGLMAIDHVREVESLIRSNLLAGRVG